MRNPEKPKMRETSSLEKHLQDGPLVIVPRWIIIRRTISAGISSSTGKTAAPYGKKGFIEFLLNTGNTEQ